MKLYKKNPKQLIRVKITRKGDDPHYITLDETTQMEAYVFCFELVEQLTVPATYNGPVTSVQFREALGGQNLKAISFSFKGLSPRDTYNLFVEAINKLQNGKEKN